MRCVIVCASKILNYGKIRRHLKKDDYFIFCDGGLNHARKLKVKPNMIIGDFDSHKIPSKKTICKTETIILPCEKDDTDSFYAAKKAASMGFSEVLLLGATGNRLDHTLVNLSILEYLENQNIPAKIIDDFSIITLLKPKKTYYTKASKYFSLISTAEETKGITIKNAKYPLENGTITSKYQYGISNEVLKNNAAEIYFKEGNLLLIESL